MFSRRTLIIIIALLVIADIVAGLWYLSLRAEVNGESHELWDSPSTEEAVAADTVSLRSAPDTFAIIRRAAFYASDRPSIAGDQNSYYTCHRRLALRWPTSVNGSAAPESLQRALIRFLTPSSTTDLETAIGDWLREARFTTASAVEYHRSESQPHIVSGYAYTDNLLIYPHSTSQRLLVMKIDRSVNSGTMTTSTSAYVHYDRLRHYVLNTTDIFDQTKENALVTLINEKITALNASKSITLEQASRVPAHFCCGRTGIMFEFAPGDIAAVGEGAIEVVVPYKQLGPVLTKPFKDLLNDNDGYWDYKRLTLTE